MIKIEKIKKKHTKFKVGDKIKWTHPYSNTLSDIGTVQSILFMEDEEFIYCDWRLLHNEIAYPAKDCELIT